MARTRYSSKRRQEQPGAAGAGLTDSREALLAVGTNGEPLPLEYGFAVRLVLPELYDYVSATKWITELKATRFSDGVAY